ncbi:MAG: thiolase C-terminal domain-containing protein [Acidimicrobiales bacterium]
MRPLPELTPETGWFWTSGEDGLLRIQRCTNCGELAHPPVPICPYCRSRSAKPTEVSGRGTIVGFTVNAHQWLPEFPPPYVIGNVALAEDPRVRLTTNIVGCDPSEVRIGQEVTVRFEHDENVWLPLFEPTGEIDPVDRVEEPVRPTPRPPPSPERFEHRAVLSGIGRSKVGRRLMVDPLSLAVDACLAAVEDAGLKLEDIDGLSTYPGGGLGMGMGEGGVSAIEEALRIQPTWINGGMEIPGQGGAVIAAAMAVATGLCRHVLCFRTVWESTFAVLRARSVASQGGGGGRQRVSGTFSEWRAPFGAMSAANWIGMNAEQYLHRYGAPREMLGLIAVTERAHAALNPDAIYRDPMTMDDYLSARPITSPFGLYDCDVPCDGSIAVIVSDASVADDLPHPAVRMEAVGTQILERLSWDQGTVTHEPQVLGQAAHLWTRTDLRPSDVDVALVYDGFSFNAISWLEGLGFCGIGEAYDWLDGGKRIALGGELPVNTHGGQLSEGRLHGFGFIYEAVLQLRHDAGARQVAGAKTAVVSTGGGTPSGTFLLQRKDA